MSDLSDIELDYTRMQKGLISIDGLNKLKEKYKNNEKILKRIEKEKIKIVTNRLLEK